MYEIKTTADAVGDIAIISYRGHMVPAEDSQIFGEAREALNNPAFAKLLVELKPGLINSMAIGQLFRLTELAKSQQKRLGIVCEIERTLEIFQITKFNTVAEIYPTLAEALTSFAAAISS